MGLTVKEQMVFGGVDSRSNPVNMPAERSVRTRNFVPLEAGHLRLRDGYAKVYEGIGAGGVHSVFPFRLPDGSKYVCFFQNKTPYIINLTTNSISAPLVRGTAIASSSRWSMYLANNRVYAFNGTDKKFFDGTAWRDVGLPALTAAQVAGVTVTDGVREISTTEAAAVVLTPAAGGTFSAGNVTVYTVFFDATTNEIGPSTVSTPTLPTTLTLNQKISVSVLPDLSTANANWVKLMAGIIGSGNVARFFTTSSVSPTAYARVSNVVTVTKAAHGFSTGDVVVASNQTDTTFSGVFAITVTDADHFTYANTGSNASTTGGTVGKIIKVANATTTVDILAPTQDSGYNVNEVRGIAKSSVGGAQPGYIFYASIYNATTGQVGNRLALNSNRYLPATARCNVKFAGLPDVAATDSEWSLLIGRTGDGAEVPYITVDALVGAWIPVTGTTNTLTVGAIDGNSELPIKNFQPHAFDKVAWVGNRAYACLPNSAFIYKSASTDDAKFGAFVGEVTESYSDLVETFPTADAVVGVQSYNYEGWFFTHSDLAILSELSATPGWQGPWYGYGIAGQYAFSPGSKSMPFWITGEKKLATMTPAGPETISDEYESALLSRIGDAYLSQTEIVYYKDAKRRIDQFFINCKDDAGVEFQVIHDFNTADSRSPYGQGYDAVFGGALASSFNVAPVRDLNGTLRIFAGGSDGNIYQLYTGLTDDGNEYVGDYINLLYAGAYRTAIKQIEWYGDPNVQWYICREMDKDFPADPSNADKYDNLTDQSPRAVPGDENNHHFHVDVERPEIIHAILWMRLTSHSEDAPASGLGLNDPPHMPLEWYGRIYAVDPLLGSARGK